jgi:ERO1-like protein alpha
MRYTVCLLLFLTCCICAFDELVCNLDGLEIANERMYEILADLRTRTFFRYFKVKLDEDCPFWAQNYFCELASCAVCECEDNEVPPAWRNTELRKEANSTLDLSLQSSFKPWVENQSSWLKQEEPDIYVNLLLNSEAYTHYQGQHIWQAIYNENCFTGPLDNMCREERFFYSLISGLHSNINTHISYNYIEPALFQVQSVEEIMNFAYPNITMWHERVGKYPERIKNFYTSFAVLVRAANRAADFIANYKYDTGNTVDDLATRNLIWQLLNITTEQCSMPFDESLLFTEAEGLELRDEIRNNFYNISRIIDCVGCEKCRLHGKLQIYGLGTAMKFLFGENEDVQRNELIVRYIQAFINTLGKFSKAERLMKEMQESVIVNVPAVVSFILTFAAALELLERRQKSKKT